MHLTLVDHLLLADDRNVVLGLAGDDAGVATDAGVQVDAHCPGRRSLGFPAIKMRLLFAAGEKARLLGVSASSAVPHDVAGHVENQVVMVGAGQIHVAGRLFKRRRIVTTGERIEVEPGAVADRADMPPAGAQQRNDAVRRLARHDPDRHGHDRLSPTDRRTLSPFRSFNRRAFAGAISSGLSQVSLVSGRGNSCSHALLA